MDMASVDTVERSSWAGASRELGRQAEAIDNAKTDIEALVHNVDDIRKTLQRFELKVTIVALILMVMSAQGSKLLVAIGGLLGA